MEFELDGELFFKCNECDEEYEIYVESSDEEMYVSEERCMEEEIGDWKILSKE